MGFLSKLKSKISKSIDTVSDEISKKIGRNKDKDTDIQVKKQLPIDTNIVEKEIIKEVQLPIEPSTSTSKVPEQEEPVAIKKVEQIASKNENVILDEKIQEPIQITEEIIEEKELIEPIQDTVESVEEEVIEMKVEESVKKGFLGKISESLKFNKIQKGLTKTRRNFLTSFATIFSGGRKIDDTLIEELEELLITSDIGVNTTDYIIDELKIRVKKEGFEDAEDCYKIIKEILYEILLKSPSAENDKAFKVTNENKPYTILVVGVNGVGKTTTIGKLAYNYKSAGKNVVIGAADTFRAAANDQLEIWAERADVQIIQRDMGSDPAAVAYDTLDSAIAKGQDVVIIDTAGRLHNKKNLMTELGKISNVMKKLKNSAPDEVYLVLDATTGQNAIIQAQEFSKVTPITGIILTKLDGTAKGGVVIPIAHTLKIPVRYIGVGEQIDDLMAFDPAYYIEGLFAITDDDIAAID